MRKVTYSNRANKDFLSIWAYIAEDSPNAADRLLDTIKEKCDLLGDNPDLGQARPDISAEMRYFPIKIILSFTEKGRTGLMLSVSCTVRET